MWLFLCGNAKDLQFSSCIASHIARLRPFRNLSSGCDIDLVCLRAIESGIGAGIYPRHPSEISLLSFVASLDTDGYGRLFRAGNPLCPNSRPFRWRWIRESSRRPIRRFCSHYFRNTPRSLGSRNRQCNGLATQFGRPTTSSDENGQLWLLPLRPRLIRQLHPRFSSRGLSRDQSHRKRYRQTSISRSRNHANRGS